MSVTEEFPATNAAVLTPEAIRRMVAKLDRALGRRPDPGVLVLAHQADVTRIRVAIAIITDHGEDMRPVEVRASPLVMAPGEAYVVDLAELEDESLRPVPTGLFDWQHRPALRLVDVDA